MSASNRGGLGPQGFRGPKGDQGVQGPTGPPGTNGVAGAQGQAGSIIQALQKVSFSDSLETPISAGNVRGVCKTSDNKRLIFCNSQQLYFSTYSSGSWSSPTPFGLQGVGGGHVTLSVTDDGNRLIVGDFSGHVFVYFWNSNTLTYDTYKQVSFDLNYLVSVSVSSDGSRIVASNHWGYIYSAYWDSNNNNYTTLTTLKPTSHRIWGDYTNLTMSNDGNIIVFGSGSYSLGPVYWSKWDNELKTFGPGIVINSQYDNNEWSGFSISSDNQVIFMISANTSIPSQYSIFDYATKNFKNSIAISTSAIPLMNGRTGMWLSRDDSTIYYLDYNGKISETSLTYNYDIIGATGPQGVQGPTGPQGPAADLSALYRTMIIPLSSNVYKDQSPPVYMESYIRNLGYDGWYYKKISTTAPNNKINWYFYPDNSMKLSDLKQLSFEINLINKASIPFIMVYTKPTGTNDGASWYKSRRTYEISKIMSNSMLNSTKYCCYVNFNANISIPISYEHTSKELSVASSLNMKDFDSNEEILQFSISTNSAAANNSVEFICKSYNIQSVKTSVNYLLSNDKVDIDALIKKYPL